MRYIVGGIQDWTALFKEAYRCCAPGGWVESVEYEPEFSQRRRDDRTGACSCLVWRAISKGQQILNRPLFVEEIQPQALDEAGFIEKKVARYKVCAVIELPFGRSSRKLTRR